MIRRVVPLTLLIPVVMIVVRLAYPSFWATVGLVLSLCLTPFFICVSIWAIFGAETTAKLLGLHRGH